MFFVSVGGCCKGQCLSVERQFVSQACPSVVLHSRGPLYEVGLDGQEKWGQLQYSRPAKQFPNSYTTKPLLLLRPPLPLATATATRRCPRNGC